MISRVIEDWHRHLRGELEGGLDVLLSDDVVFYSPIVFTPQRGKAITKLYLTAAGSTLGGDEPAPEAGAGEPPEGAAPTKFRYVKQILSGNQAMLEFETTMDGKYVNGVDIITCDESGKIIEFKVMIRPLQAINLVHQQMKAMLEQMS